MSRRQKDSLRPLITEEQLHLQQLSRSQAAPATQVALWCVLREAGLSWQKSRTWCDTGTVQ